MYEVEGIEIIPHVEMLQRKKKLKQTNKKKYVNFGLTLFKLFLLNMKSREKEHRKGKYTKVISLVTFSYFYWILYVCALCHCF